MVLDNDLKFLNKDLEDIMSKEFGNTRFSSEDLERQYENVRDWQMITFEKFISLTYGEMRSPLVCKEFTEDFVKFMKDLKYASILRGKIPTSYEMKNDVLKSPNKWVEVFYKNINEYGDPLVTDKNIGVIEKAV